MENREKIAERALALFAARGYEAVGVQEICEAAGVTKPTLYYYFGSKGGLLEALLGDSFRELTRRLVAAAEYHGDLPLTLTRVVQTLFGFAREQPTFYRLHLALWFAPRESEAFRVVVAYEEEIYRVVEEMFARAVESHGNMRGRQRQYAVTLLGTVNTLIGLALNGFAELDDELAHRAVRQFSHGIYS